MKAVVGVLIAVLLVSGCASASSTTYDSADVGRTIETASGTVVASRSVDVKGGTSVAGPVAGGAIGGATGGLVFGSGWAGLLGAVLGAGVGYVTEQQINSGEGTEYVVEMDDGRTVTIVQNKDDDTAPIADGTQVLVQYSGKYTRILKDPRTDRTASGSGTESGRGTESGSAGGGGWVDPDIVGTSPPAPERDDMAAPSLDTWEPVDPIEPPVSQQ